MSAHTFSKKIDQKEYLRKYMSGDKHKKKKKKDKHHDGREKVRIIDDDVHVPEYDKYIDEELLLVGDDAPQIVGEYIEERSNGDERKSKWKAIGMKEEYEEDTRNIKMEPEDLWGKKASDIKLERNYSPDRKNYKSKLKKHSSDISPARRRPSLSPQNVMKRNNSIDMSPPRRKRNYQSSISPQRRYIHTKEDKGKQYSIKKERRSLSSDMSPPRRVRKSSNDRYTNYRSKDSPPKLSRRSKDLSPPRYKQNNFSPKRKRNFTDDYSPSRRNNNHSNYNKDFGYNKRQATSPSFLKTKRSPSPFNKNHRNPFKQSPKRDNLNQYPNNSSNNNVAKSSRWNGNNSPKRLQKDLINQRRISDQSPPRRQKQNLSPRRYDKNPFRHEIRDSPSRRMPFKKQSMSPKSIKREKYSNDFSSSSKRYSKDFSPSRKRSPNSYHNKSNYSRGKSSSPPPTHKPKESRTLDGKKAGLQDAYSLRLENDERRRREDIMYANMSTELTGRDAEVNVRNTGRKSRRARLAEEEDPEIKRQKEEREQERKDLYDRWGKGLKQIEDYKKKKAEYEYESTKPLARHRDDEDLERHLKEREYADDPMLAYMRQKRKDREKAENKPIIPKYEGSYAENRFGIRPGYRWDGVDRSNGFEKKWFDVQNEKRALQDDAYKYSVEDM